MLGTIALQQISLCDTLPVNTYPTTTPRVVSCTDSQTGWPSLPLASTVSSLPGAPQCPFVLPWCPAATHPRAVGCGPSQPTPLTVFYFMSCHSGWVEFTFLMCACTYCACTQCVLSVCYEHGTTTGLVSCCGESGQRI